MNKRIIQFRQLGKFGRFGNQIFQYLFARAYAEQHDATLEIPHWIGEKIFKDVAHPTPSKMLPTLEELPEDGRVDINFHGYCQGGKFLSYLSESKIREWLQFEDKWVEMFSVMGSLAIAHLRRGDYQSKWKDVFCVISKNSYLNACNKFGIEKASLSWKSEEMQVKWRYVDEDLIFLPDFFDMINAKHLFRANSTFSFWAGFFNKNKVYSPLVENKVGECDVDFVEGNWPKIVSINPDIIFKD